MLTSAECFKLYGDPYAASHRTMYHLPPELLVIRCLPASIYCNKDMEKPLNTALHNVIERNLAHTIKTYDGCTNIRKMRTSNSMSLHSWGVAVDINAALNPMGQPSVQPPELVKCFTDAGFDWGGTWHTPDPMHFQLKG
jgi:hypothetical protein